MLILKRNQNIEYVKTQLENITSSKFYRSQRAVCLKIQTLKTLNVLHKKRYKKTYFIIFYL